MWYFVWWCVISVTSLDLSVFPVLPCTFHNFLSYFFLLLLSPSPIAFHHQEKIEREEKAQAEEAKVSFFLLPFLPFFFFKLLSPFHPDHNHIIESILICRNIQISSYYSKTVANFNNFCFYSIARKSLHKETALIAFTRK